MNLKEIKEIIKLMNENDLSQVEVEREGSKIKISKGPTDAPVVVSRSACPITFTHQETALALY